MPRLYVGTYTRRTDSEGIYVCDWEPATGRTSGLTLAAAADNPSFLVIRDDVLLAVSETDDHDGRPQGAVSSFCIDDGGLSLTGTLPTHGAQPCHLAAHQDEVAVANYAGGSIAIFGLAAGVLTGTRRVIQFNAYGPHPRQSSAHPHGVYYRGGELLVPDLGADRIHRFRASTGHALQPIEMAPASGPRHLAIGTSGHLYVVNELANTVAVIDRGRVVQTVSTLPRDAAVECSAAGIAQDPRGRRLFVSNRGHDSLVSWALDPDTGLLGAPEHGTAGGAHPRHFVVDDGGRWVLVANRDTDEVSVIALSAEGAFAGIAATLACPAPVCLAIAP